MGMEQQHDLRDLRNDNHRLYERLNEINNWAVTLTSTNKRMMNDIKRIVEISSTR